MANNYFGSPMAERSTGFDFFRMATATTSSVFIGMACVTTSSCILSTVDDYCCAIGASLPNRTCTNIKLASN